MNDTFGIDVYRATLCRPFGAMDRLASRRFQGLTPLAIDCRPSGAADCRHVGA